ncbi:hypothetical protein [Pseudomonas sp.]|uniref:hypothetical protein n=1 Tax=Pseudomonas sp. TaxID=306 RepID=UPI002906A9EC|nr:hypothetical protein [Pseudomonas sp.]MDU4252659.1 hypothetical protein [Pseudomonas sp.]
MVTNLFADVGLPTLQQGACHIFISLLINDLRGFPTRQGAANSGKAATRFLAARGKAASLPLRFAAPFRWPR